MDNPRISDDHKKTEASKINRIANYINGNAAHIVYGAAAIVSTSFLIAGTYYICEANNTVCRLQNGEALTCVPTADRFLFQGADINSSRDPYNRCCKAQLRMLHTGMTYVALSSICIITTISTRVIDYCCSKKKNETISSTDEKIVEKLDIVNEENNVTFAVVSANPRGEEFMQNTDRF